ncbi:helix-turn-helix domain-containing protein [Providencia manganoxydans]|uniref:helix-turn-helix domain-containing protein n=1 Tax=Providencia manganoxydans TaxID=2923283 RepID=UPI0034DDB47F
MKKAKKIEDIKLALAISIGEELQKLRKSRNLTGKVLAEKLGVSQQQISRYERGICRIDTDTLLYTLQLLGTSLTAFFLDVSLNLKEKNPGVYLDFSPFFESLEKGNQIPYFTSYPGHYFG